ncbi:uncharacterized protein BKA55DRAFT_546889 [Fusarium redolens]|uniref:Uncharacterized protein n=1 Tax=Fusarium redolens TaxID=48865 RepID=A0A9P9FWM2_FUSRE|nr:uncharacterized protein BKA55DRAFT_546889 [Fusarium redolens]KAH7208467.1 hypothetical protein BKA55DRAFT_546889 [Fusarium redolens]
MPEANSEMNYSEVVDVDYLLFPESDARIGFEWDTTGDPDSSLQLSQTGVENNPWIPFADDQRFIADPEADFLTEYSILSSTVPSPADYATPWLDTSTIIQSLDQQLLNGPSSSGSEATMPSLNSTCSPFMNDNRVPLTLSMPRNNQHDHSNSKRVKTLDELPNELKFLISRRMERQPWDTIHTDFKCIFGDVTKMALKMRLSRLRSTNPNVQELFNNESSSMPIKCYSDHGNHGISSVDSHGAIYGAENYNQNS